MTEIAGSLWSVPPAEQLDAALRLRSLGLRRLHWDMTDGIFADPGGFTAGQARSLTAASDMSAEAHIMANDTLQEVDPWTDFCDLVVVHAESRNWQAAVERIADRDCVPGLAISPQTPTSVVPADLTVLCMAIVPGTAGSAFDATVLERVGALRAASPTRRIGIDGGVQRRHIESAEAAGANWLVVGTDLFLNPDIERWTDILRDDSVT